MKVSMVRKDCTQCGKNTFHNIRVKEGKVLGERCTKCGYPPLDGNANSDKRAAARVRCAKLSGKPVF